MVSVDRNIGDVWACHSIPKGLRPGVLSFFREYLSRNFVHSREMGELGGDCRRERRSLEVGSDVN